MLLRSLIKLLLLSVAFCIEVTVWAQSERTTLTNCLDVLKLTPAAANEQFPVRVRGVVTGYAPESQICFVQDDTAGIYVQPAPWPRELRFGEIVEVEGVTAQGRFSPIIHLAVIRRTGATREVQARRVTADEFNSGRFDCQYIELEAVVQNAIVLGNVVSLQLVAGGSPLSAMIFSLNSPPTNTTDARVKIRGVAGTFYTGEQLTGFGVFLEDPTFLEIVRPPPAPFSQPVRSLNNVHAFSPDGALDHRIQVRGAVTAVWPGDSFFIQDTTGAIRVSPSDAGKMPKAGEVVEVSGFLRNALGLNPSLAHALWRKVGETNVATPKVGALTQLSGGPARGQLVTLEGVVLGVTSSNKVSTLILQEDEQTIRAFSPQPLSPKLNDSVVRVSGVFSTPPESLKSQEKCLLLSGTNAVSVVRSPPVEASSRSASRLLTVASIVAALIMAAVATASYKGLRQSHSQAQANVAQIAEAEREIAQLKDARERLGRDLHDHIIQSIYAIGLSLEDCRQSTGDSGRTESRLKSALVEINDVIRELRNVISGLETNTIQPKEFRTALKSLALTLSHDQSNRIRMDLDQTALDALSPGQATELIHIAREAMSNSVRHGHSQTTSVSLHTHEDLLRFTVEDDGDGFDLQNTEPKGFGLRNMAKRAEDLGAKFTIHAQKGVGTRIVLDIEKQKQHFSQSEPRSRIDR